MHRSGSPIGQECQTETASGELLGDRKKVAEFVLAQGRGMALQTIGLDVAANSEAQGARP